MDKHALCRFFLLGVQHARPLSVTQASYPRFIR